jgi:hypothetical protein
MFKVEELCWLINIHMQCCGSGFSCGGPPNWPPGTGSVILNCGSSSRFLLFIKDSKKFQKKVQYFIICNKFLPI